MTQRLSKEPTPPPVPAESQGEVLRTVPVRRRGSVADVVVIQHDAAPAGPDSPPAPEGAAPEGRVAKLAELGGELFGYRLRRELGRGAFARVFLAEQAGLAGRPVVLKISAIEGREPQTLAQMQHTHIVPIYSLHEDRWVGLRAVCMPHLGGASLAQVLQALPPRPASGEQLAVALERVQLPRRGSEDDGTPPPAPCTRFRGWSYVRAVAWIVARLAEGLQHAHERGVLHRDIKPSNILLAGDGQPLLLDFNVAEWDHGAPGEVLLGGTAAYAAPEHLEALLAPTPERIAGVDRRSDIYALGIVLYEMLSGTSPFQCDGGYSRRRTALAEMARERGRGLPQLRPRRRDIPWSLESIVRRCLAPDPERRYQQAEHLAEDLRRFLDDRPLRYAPELSRVERVHKWLRRHPALTSSGFVAAVAGLLLVAALSTVVGVRAHLSQAREQLRASQDRDRAQAYETGTLRALCLVNTVAELDDHLAQGVPVCRETLALYGVLDRADWQEQPAWQRLSPEARRRLGENTRELLQLLAWARTHAAPRDPAALAEALALLERAEEVGGLTPSRALGMERARYLDALGETASADRIRAESERLEPVTAQDHYLLATAYARASGRADLRRAVEELNRALRADPRHYWALMQRGICRQELGDAILAAADFSTCIGLQPDSPWGYFNRGHVLGQTGRRAEALADFTAALDREPGSVPARVNRALVRLEVKEYAAAMADFDEAQRQGRDDASLHAGRGMALEALGRPGEADAAFAAAFARAAALPAEARRRLRWTYGFAVAARRPAEAREAFAAVLREDPRQPQALYGQAMLLVDQGQLEEARSFAARAVEASPGWVDARRCRAIILARLGDFAAAEQDVNACLEREPDSGVTLYAAACVAARAAAHSAQPSLRTQALDFLRRAFAEGYGQDRAGTDPDLESLRQESGFLDLLRAFEAPRPVPAG